MRAGPPASWFFLLAVGWGLVVVPPWAAGLWPATAAAHAHELLYGYTLAVVAGFLLTRGGAVEVAALVALWVAGRLGAWLSHPKPGWAAAAEGAFVLWVAWRGAGPLVTGARRWRNAALGWGAAAACLLELPLQAALRWGGPAEQEAALRAALAAFAFLLVGMGGRALAPALAGAWAEGAPGEAFARTLRNAVQPRLEGAALACCALAALLLPWTATRAAGGLALLLAGVATGVRVWRWRPWRVRRPAVAALAGAYAWLPPGLAVWGLAELGATPSRTAVHLLTVGALGGLTVVMMARTAALRLRAGLDGFGDVAAAAAAMGTAALLRISGFEMAAAAAWAGALALVGTRLLRQLRRPALPAALR